MASRLLGRWREAGRDVVTIAMVKKSGGRVRQKQPLLIRIHRGSQPASRRLLRRQAGQSKAERGRPRPQREPGDSQYSRRVQGSGALPVNAEVRSGVCPGYAQAGRHGGPPASRTEIAFPAVDTHEGLSFRGEAPGAQPELKCGEVPGSHFSCLGID